MSPSEKQTSEMLKVVNEQFRDQVLLELILFKSLSKSQVDYDYRNLAHESVNEANVILNALAYAKAICVASEATDD